MPQHRSLGQREDVVTRHQASEGVVAVGKRRIVRVQRHALTALETAEGPPRHRRPVRSSRPVEDLPRAPGLAYHLLHYPVSSTASVDVDFFLAKCRSKSFFPMRQCASSAR